MKKSFLALALAALTGAAVYAEPAMLPIPLKNANFEEGLKPWQNNGRVPKGATGADAISVVDDAEAGSKVLEIRDPWTDAQPYAIQYFNVTPQKGQQFKLTFRAKAPKGHVFMVGVQCLSQKKYLGNLAKNFTGTGEWKEYSATLARIPAEACRFTVALYVTPWDYKRTGTVRFDDIKIALEPDPLFVEAVPADKAKLGGKQIELCMVGDSITWAGHGDYFRGFLVKEMPNLAFVGTHTAELGYSHAGEGGDHTGACVKGRIDDPTRIPNARYYHLLMGVNDSAGTKNEESAPANARRIADQLMTMCGKLLARPGTEKVFLGTILPCYPGWIAKPDEAMLRKFQLRDLTASKVNEILRAEAVQKFGGKVVLVEYEKPLRARPDWKKEIMLHPTIFGYSVVAPILAEVLKKETTPSNGPAGEYGVEVVNLWDDAKQATGVVIPGWYVISFEAENAPDGKAQFELVSGSEGLRKDQKPIVEKISATVEPGKRAHAVALLRTPRFLGREIYTVKNANCTLKKIKIEKMRPDRLPTPYNTGRVVDTSVTPFVGELLVPAK